MLRLSWSGLLERWSAFAGAVLTVCLGVALVQSSLLLLLTSATADAPAGATAVQPMSFDEARIVAVTVEAVTLALAAFLAVFVIASTFAFTVDQRRQELALLRLVGAGRRHVMRLLLGEAVLLGVAGSLAGSAVGVGLVRVQQALMVRLGLLPGDFSVQWRVWVLPASIALGTALALAGVFLAARRAARVRPLEALRAGEEPAGVMTRGRWITGAVLGAGALALAVLSPLGGPAGGRAMAVCVSLCAALALATFAPLAVPALARLLPARAGTLGDLARANLRDEVRRSASTAAPLIVLVGLLLGQTGAAWSYTAAAQRELRQDTAAQVVVESTLPAAGAGPAAAFTGVSGVATTSTEVELPAAVTTGTGEMAFTEISRVLVVDPAAYERLHAGSGPLAALRGRALAAGPGALGTPVGSEVGVRVGETDLGRLPVVAGVPQTVGGGPALLLPEGLLPADVLAGSPARTFVQLQPGADPRRVAAALAAAAGPGAAVSVVDDWLQGSARAAASTDTSILVVVMGLGALYALIGVVNSGVVATSARRREFATARASGLTRRQVVGSALLETWTVTGAGVLLGVVAAAGTLAAVLITTASATGSPSLDLPWVLAGSLVAGAFVVTGATSAWTAWSATRAAPVSLLRARE
ncbi:putative ABC transport system permease protein [Kineococcus radiotolerans]|uniref:Putative ABC transport system permease protein n=1 Tax=Kineococcus radiotolerans TaxID=131568 RepID=A0A7W4XVT5_KINRA|nr:ABC transporter permease [Kineococcus radiotolerans]MBB2899430.1 putative ABC transport system permease protein [Kineococcus radiotolerans]